ncbi:MAG: hypothetical protein A2Y17_05810 [Clostridiales bacterium GWF2_38_85]|nr:MAG: hypothetical protein A2Y17_05810 [Clostridiales bacterium GWF2_38_85]HBL84002.1 hypothetical protein [Clostridiales bacterium]
MENQDCDISNIIFFLSQKVKSSELSEIEDDDYFKNQDYNAIKTRNETYNTYLENYVLNYIIKSSSQRRLRNAFFIIITTLLIILVMTCCLAIFIVASKLETNLSDSITVISAISGVISAFFILPKVIAMNLFPQYEEDKTAELFSMLLSNDMSLRGFYEKQKQYDINREEIEMQKDIAKSKEGILM